MPLARVRRAQTSKRIPFGRRGHRLSAARPSASRRSSVSVPADELLATSGALEQVGDVTAAEAVNEVADVVLVAAPFELADVGEKRVIRFCVGAELFARRLAEINRHVTAVGRLRPVLPGQDARCSLSDFVGGLLAAPVSTSLNVTP